MIATFPNTSFVDGSFIPEGDGHPRKLIDPATGEADGQTFDATPAQIDAAIRSAHRTYASEWADLAPGKRSELLHAIANTIEERVEEFAWADCRNMGKPISAARGEARYAAAIFRYYAGALRTFFGNTIPIASGNFNFTLRQPLGVVAAIVPWNFPLPIAAWKIAPALAAGNCAVLKPADITPWSALLLARAASDVGLPAGALQVLLCSGRTAEQIVTHPLIRKISFTGSTAVGKHLIALAANDLKRISLELGGKSANVVFGDCDLAKAAESAPMSVFDNTGQDCCARSRILLEQSIEQPFLERMLAATVKLKIGDPRHEETQLGPIARREQFEKVCAFVDAAKKAGRQILCGGAPLESRGFFYPPTIIAGCESTDPWWREEIFGPVVCVRSFRSEDEALAEANDSPYGLSGSLWTHDLTRALRFARKFETGVLSINTHGSVHLEAPFGGFKQSGIGRDLGVSALEQFTEVKTISIAI